MKTLFRYFFGTALFLAGSSSLKLSAQFSSEQVPAKQDSAKAPQYRKAPVLRESNPRSNDLLHTRLELSFDWEKSRLNGRATLSLKPLVYATDKLYLDARGMEIKSLNVYARPDKSPKAMPQSAKTDVSAALHLPSSYVYENDSLKISLGKTIRPYETYTVQIEYLAKPNELKKAGGSAAIMEDKGLYFVNPLGENPFKMPQIWTQGETQSNSVWFPTIDSPNERMTQEILMTVDQKYTTLSNGKLIASKPLPGGKRLDHWKLSESHAPYLAMMAVGEFKKVTDAPWKGKEISYYVEKEYEPYAKAIFGDTREMIDFYSKRLGVDYPWPKYAQVVVRDYVSGAMENTSATLHGDFMVYQTAREMLDGKKGDAVIAHELFHQWFGDLVTCESWSHLPLNESFATYGEYLWKEYKYGRGEADAHRYASKMGYFSSEQEKHLIRYEYKSQEDMFDAFSYNKGGQVLHMMRKTLGDEAFFAGLKLYLEQNKFKPVEIHHLRLAMEESSGQDLNWFFDQWFLKPGRPKLKVQQRYNADDKTVVLRIEQNQDLNQYPLYRIPLEVDLYLAGKLQREHIVLRDQVQEFRFQVLSQPALVNVDAERQLLCDWDYPKSAAEYLFQYNNGPLFEDRMEALKALESSMSDPVVFALFCKAASADVLPDIRKQAISKLDKSPKEFREDLKKTLLSIYEKDAVNTVRVRALNLLNRQFSGEAFLQALNEAALKEQSYLICGEALEALGKSDPKLAMQKAVAFEDEPSKKLIFVIANLYAEQGGDEQLSFFHRQMKQISGFETMTYVGAYTKLAKKSQSAAAVERAAQDLENCAKGAGRFVKFACSKSIKDLLSLWEGKVNTYAKAMETSKSSDLEFAEADKKLREATELRDKLSAINSRMSQSNEK